LRPGGIMFHGVGPWLAPAGAHTACTLDFPWGHARLGSDDFRRYIMEVRPHEAAHAISCYDGLFNRPRMTMHENLRAIADAGLSVLSWTDHWNARHAPSADVLREVLDHHPTATLRDLGTETYALVLTKRSPQGTKGNA
ncbi:MAG: hypothetical protein ACT4PT_14230, partial [Methanobacteriota archaeon]